MSTMRTTLILVGVLAVAACSSGPGEPPNLPAPEYEPPRAYDPDTAIDGGEVEDAIPDAPPPEPPPPAETDAPDGAEGGAGEGAEGAGGAAPES